MKKGKVILGAAIVGAILAVGSAAAQASSADGFFVSHEEAIARGGVGNYVAATDVAKKAEPVVQARVWEPEQRVIPGGGSQVFHFDPGETQLSLDERDALDQIANRMNHVSDSKLLIEGYSDGSGSAREDLAISSDRANSVVAYLEGKGITSDRLQSMAYGKTRAKNGVANAGERKVVISQETG